MEPQTAVEWFAEQDTLAIINFIEGKINEIELAIKKATILEKAKQLEKEQINDKTNTKPNYDFISGYKAAEKELPTWDDVKLAIELANKNINRLSMKWTKEDIIREIKKFKTK